MSLTRTLYGRLMFLFVQRQRVASAWQHVLFAHTRATTAATAFATANANPNASNTQLVSLPGECSPHGIYIYLAFLRAVRHVLGFNFCYPRTGPTETHLHEPHRLSNQGLTENKMCPPAFPNLVVAVESGCRVTVGTT